MIASAHSYVEKKVAWNQSVDPSHPFEAEFNSDRLVIRVNDFPDENLYTLFVNDEEVLRFDEWPGQWRKPLPAIQQHC